MKFSLRFNNDLPVARYVELARAAERFGFAQFWVSHDLFLRHVWVILAAVAQATERIEVGTCIVNPYSTNLAEIAMAAATLDELAGGRFNLGIGAGAADFLSWIGIEQAHPLAAMRESIMLLRRLFDGERAPFDGAFVKGWTDEAYLRFAARRVPMSYCPARPIPRSTAPTSTPKGACSARSSRSIRPARRERIGRFCAPSAS